jgi:hypothetical protein
MPTTRALFALALACGFILVSLPAPTYAGSAEYGRTWRKDGVLRGDCHEYGFRYRVRPGRYNPATTGRRSSSSSIAAGGEWRAT